MVVIGADSVMKLAAILLFLLAGGCATIDRPAPDTKYQRHLGRVAVVATEQVPELKFEGFVRGKGEGAAIGAGSSLAACLAGFSQGSCTGWACGGAMIIVIGVCGIASLVGGVAGAVAAPSADVVAASEASFARAIEVRTVQQSVRHAVEDAAQAAGVPLVSLPEEVTREAAAALDYRLLQPLGVDAVLETTLTKAGTQGAGINAPSTAYMEVHVRLVDTATNKEMHAADYLYLGRRLDLEGWSAMQAKPLIDELDKGYRTLGAHIHDNIFRLYSYPDRDWHSAGGALSVSFGLAPIYPPTRGALTGDRWIGAWFEWYAVENMRPHFRWEAFPRASDLAAAGEEMARIENVSYDLVVAREENMSPAEIIYRREGLPRPEHQIEISLRPEARYFWTVRARFQLDGRSRVTEWASTHFISREQITAPSQFSYRFRTPGRD